jgi:hypothetical protein
MRRPARGGVEPVPSQVVVDHGIDLESIKPVPLKAERGRTRLRSNESRHASNHRDYCAAARANKISFEDFVRRYVPGHWQIKSKVAFAFSRSESIKKLASRDSDLLVGRSQDVIFVDGFKRVPKPTDQFTPLLITSPGM